MAKKTQGNTTKQGGQGDIEAIRHAQASRRNIPSEEGRDFMRAEEREDRRRVFDMPTSADPQLIWKGKSKEAEMLVEAPVIYKQENISAQMIVKGLRDFSDGEKAREEKKQEKILGEHYEMFEDHFDGLDDREKVDFYQHDHSWQNRMVFGDSLQVMTSLLEREGMRGQVQCVYIDPPYGINFSSNWQVSTKERNVKNSEADSTAEPEMVKAFRDTWHEGIHSYLDYWRNRFRVAHELLKETGSIFVQIGDQNVHLIRNLLDEVFGAKNFKTQIVFRKSSPLGSKKIAGVVDYILWYFKDVNNAKSYNLFTHKSFGEDSHFNMIMDGNRNKIPMTQEHIKDKNILKNHIIFSSEKLSSAGYTVSCMFDFNFHGKLYKCGAKSWRTNKSGIERLIKADRILASGTIPRFIPYFTDFPVKILNNLWVDTYGAVDPMYVVQTTNSVIQRCLLMATDPGDLVLDPTCGSGTTAYVAEQWGRRWITCDTSRVALALARSRLMNASFPHYKLKDPKNTAEGFHYKSVPHISLKDIAHNKDIDRIWEDYEAKLQPLRTKLGAEHKAEYKEDWQVPRDSASSPSPAADLASSPSPSSSVSPDLATYNRLRRERQAAIDAAIQDNATQELLYDQPLEEKKTVRVSGPFTVESLQPFQLPAEDLSTAEQNARNDDRYTQALIQQLRRAGVESSDKANRITFSRLDPNPDDTIAAIGYFQEIKAASKIASEKTPEQATEKIAAVCFGPQYATVNKNFLKNAVYKVVKSNQGNAQGNTLGFDLLILCGFAFAPDLHEETQNFGRLQVRLAKMDATLADPEQHLHSKKGQSDNLFMVFGEPDIEITASPDNPQLFVVTVKGVNVFHPATNELTSCRKEDIACWFIDTNYTGECFFVRHAYFTGAKDPYKQLQRALNSSINAQAWESLRSNTSRPFAKPETGKIAVKVINHYGDEVTKTFSIT